MKCDFNTRQKHTLVVFIYYFFVFSQRIKFSVKSFFISSATRINATFLNLTTFVKFSEKRLFFGSLFFLDDY